MSKEVDKHGIDSPFYLRLPSANGLNSINRLVCNFEDNCLVRVDCLLHFFSWFEDLDNSPEDH